MTALTVEREVITVDGEQYERIDGAPQAGDLVRAENEELDVTKGRLYRVISVNGREQPRIRDDVNERQRLSTSEYNAVYRKIDAAETYEVDGVKYRAVTDREHRIGDYLYAHETMGGFTKGKVYAITDVDDDGDAVFTNDDGNTRYFDGVSKVMTLVERADEADYHVHEGVKYRKVKRKAREGERVLVVANTRKDRHKASIGDVLTVERQSSGGAVHCGFCLNLDHADYVVLEPCARKVYVTDPGELYTTYDDFARKYGYPNAARSCIGKKEPVEGEQVTILTSGPHLGSNKLLHIIRTAAGDEYIIGDNGVSDEPPQPPRLKVGDYAKVVDTKLRTGGERRYLTHGQIAKVVCADKSEIPYEAQLLGDGTRHWFRADALASATDEEVAAATKPKFEPGDYARVETLGEYSDIPVGTTVKVTNVVSEDAAKHNVRAEFLDGHDYDWFKPEQLTPATDEEAKWARIGRKPNEYKVGDIVRVVNGFGSQNKTGEIGEIVAIEDDIVPYKVNTAHATDGNWQLARDIELVCPVEQRVDRDGE